MEHPETLPFAFVLKVPDISLEYGAVYLYGYTYVYVYMELFINGI